MDIFDCQVDGINMSELIQIKLNQPEKVTDWRDEDGCKERGTGFLFNKYKIS